MRCAFLSILVLATVAVGSATKPGFALADDAPISQGTQHIEAGPISVDLTLDRTTLNAADSLIVTLQVASPPSVAVELPTVQEKLGGFTVASSGDEPARTRIEQAQARTLITRRFTLDPFLPGDYTLPSLEVRWRRTDSGESGVARTAAATIHVVSLLPESAQSPDADSKALDPGTIRDPYSPPFHRSRTPLILGAATAIGAAFLAAWGVSALRRRRGGTDVVAVLVNQIGALRAAPDRSAVDLGHQLADALRTALANRVDPAARSLVAAEITTRLPRGSLFSGGHAQAVEQLLESLDAVRFSADPITPERREQLIDETLSVLRTLRDRPPLHPEARA